MRYTVQPFGKQIHHTSEHGPFKKLGNLTAKF